jgi:hypothetical protein
MSGRRFDQIGMGVGRARDHNRINGRVGGFRLKFGNSTLADLARWPPQLHRSPTLMEY